MDRPGVPSRQPCAADRGDLRALPMSCCYGCEGLPGDLLAVWPELFTEGRSGTRGAKPRSQAIPAIGTRSQCPALRYRELAKAVS
jgi:hypothetical protein